MTLTAADLFCGAGGSVTGLANAGFTVVVGANHSARAIETVSANHRDTDFLCTDINHYDMRRLPRTQVLWASVICTEMSPAGGHRKTRGQRSMPGLEEFGHVSGDTYERTRACALDVIRATEVHRYDAVVVENVVEFARDWELYDWWVEGMCRLGYSVEVANVSAAHVWSHDNPPAPQWRDRIFIVFVRKGIKQPDLRHRPLAWCVACEKDVEAEQRWKNPHRRRVGKYRQQYVYACPKCSKAVEPYVAPSLSALDLADIGERIGDRKRPLSPNTLARIEWGLANLAQPLVAQVAGNTYERPGYHRVIAAPESPLTTRQASATDAVIMVNSNYDDTRVYRADSDAMPSRTTKIGDGVLQPFVTTLRTHVNGSAITSPINTIATGNHHYLTSPPGAFYVKSFGGNAQPKDLAKPLSHPLGAITTHDHHHLVIPYPRGKRAYSVHDPLRTLTTHDSAALLKAAIAVEDCHYRMLSPREAARGQRFADSYVITGNKGEQTAQVGNAVAVNCAYWIGRQLAEVLA